MPVTFALLSTPRRYSGELSSSYFVECHSIFFKEKFTFICIYPKKVVPLPRQRSMAMKGIRWIVVLWASLMLSPMMAQTSALVVGLRGGATILDVGGTGMVDLRYAWYGDLIGGCHLGLAVGAGIG